MRLLTILIFLLAVIAIVYLFTSAIIQGPIAVLLMLILAVFLFLLLTRGGI
ncbi:hypothetical protein AAXE64_27725 [Priestia megaterium]|uniref:hypothetical protein n=1 Tax=Priestia megaterium TaxID=1404 RepID=UPI003CFFE65B